MREAYQEWRPQRETLRLVLFIDELCNLYMAQGFKLSVRQLYYQLVAKAILANNEGNYQKVIQLVNRGRLAGYIDWDAIEDRGRDIELRTRWKSPAQIVNAAARSYHEDMWTTQSNRVFVVVEKAALAGVLSGVCTKWDVPLLAARGYPSISIVREMAEGYIKPCLEADQLPVILHLGDHDPSGIDMTRDLEDRLKIFLPDSEWETEWDVSRIALTMAQIREVDPPENPAKQTDSRFKEYARKYGYKSWELDALPPQYLVDLVDAYITSSLDEVSWYERRAEVERRREDLTAAAQHFAEYDS